MMIKLRLDDYFLAVLHLISDVEDCNCLLFEYYFISQ